MEVSARFSISARRMSRSIIRELLKLTRKKGLISFAGGLPHPSTFPSHELAEMCTSILEDDAAMALQYSPTEGIPSLRESLRAFLKERGFDSSNKELVITSASQQSLDLISKIFVDRGDTIITENPSYLGALSAFRAYGGRFITVDIDTEGLRTDLLRAELKELSKTAGTGNEYYQNMPKFIYTIPDFQNPAGVVMSYERRKEMLEIAEEFDLIIVEDVPYRWLRYSGRELPMLSAMDKSGRVIGLFTFSKIFSPGMRLGWLVADEKIMDKVIQAKQATDLCTSAFTQAIADKFIRSGLIDKRIEENISIYKKKLKVMLDSLDKYLPEDSRIEVYKTEGGLFLWLKLPEYIDTDEMFTEAIDRDVAYVIGSAFFPNGGGHNTMRLNFSFPSEDEIREGIKRLSGLIRDRLS